MKIMYIDESGDTIPLTQKGKNHLVLSGLIIDEGELLEIDRRFREIKKRYYQNEEVEIKSNFLRYANPDLPHSSPIKLKSREKYDQLEDEITALLKKIDGQLISIVVDKQGYWSQYPSQNPYNIAYIFLLERFQKFLEASDSLGICIIDPREGQVEKHFIGKDLQDIHDRMRNADGKIWRQCDHVAEKLLFSQSDATNGIQLVDMLCYPVFHIFEYNKGADEYWRFSEISNPKFLRSGERLDGVGLKYFPEEKKKDLKFFNS
ncbi:DUF3800 domain-containing protein [Candidatus Dojkabacteria bacterium]|nr:DUF3800 domain-containing protein [Candidatus Dojkabacteria bacterium]